MFVALAIIIMIILAVAIFLRQPMFGAKPGGNRLKRILSSANYSNDQFQNLHKTPALTEGETYWGITKRFFFSKKPRNKPASAIPFIKTNLHTLERSKDLVIWFGHSSYYLQLNGNRILVDPVFSGYASPVSFTTKSFKGANEYSDADIPALDYLIITHDHWDHLDHKTVLELKPSVKKIITSLGVGAHLERWGYDKEMILEMDWMQEKKDNDFHIICQPARHFSGRGFKRNGTLWSSFILRTGNRNIYVGGDSGYDDHFKKIGEGYGPFDIAILENGQYDAAWKYIHMMPEQVVQAALDLRANYLLPVHWAKFPLGIHQWDDPILRLSAEAGKRSLPLLTPKIGEVLYFDSLTREFEKWWENVL